MPAILSLGEVLWDLLPDGAQFGGAPANFACHAALLGADVSLLSAVGDDQRGVDALSMLSKYGVDTNFVQVVEGAVTGTVDVTIDDAGKPAFAIEESSSSSLIAWDRINWAAEIEARIKTVDAVYFGTLGQRSIQSRNTIRRCVELACQQNKLCIVDVNLRAPFFDRGLIRDSIKLANVLKLSDEELPTVFAAYGMDASQSDQALLRQLLKVAELDIVVMTRGGEGAMLVAEEEQVEQPGISTTVCDTVGAGDAFTAAFLLSLLQGETHDQVLHAACVQAATTCRHAGAVPVL